MKCSQAGCIQTDVQPYKKFIGRGLVLLCGSCASALQSIGMSLTLVERRESDVTPMVERRRIAQPAWLSRISARDETGRMSA